MLASSY